MRGCCLVVYNMKGEEMILSIAEAMSFGISGRHTVYCNFEVL
jgi:hypothetical protein